MPSRPGSIRSSSTRSGFAARNSVERPARRRRRRAARNPRVRSTMPIISARAVSSSTTRMRAFIDLAVSRWGTASWGAAAIASCTRVVEHAATHAVSCPRRAGWRRDREPARPAESAPRTGRAGADDVTGARPAPVARSRPGPRSPHRATAPLRRTYAPSTAPPRRPSPPPACHPGWTPPPKPGLDPASPAQLRHPPRARRSRCCGATRKVTVGAALLIQGIVADRARGARRGVTLRLGRASTTAPAPTRARSRPAPSRWAIAPGARRRSWCSASSTPACRASSSSRWRAAPSARSCALGALLARTRAPRSGR